MPRKKKAITHRLPERDPCTPPADVADVAEDAGEVPEFTRVCFGAKRGKYYTSVGTYHPGAQVSLPWMEALVFIDRGDAEAVGDAG